ncbi:IGEB protein, partial [Nyctibius grandis]|nr:IGEB protein [Nyctibius grandis]
VKHVTGIPHSPTGQGIIERTHRTIKEYLRRQKEVDTDPTSWLHKVFFALNFLCLTGDREEPPVVVHHQQLKFNNNTIIPQLQVIYWEPATGEWKEP